MWLPCSFGFLQSDAMTGVWPRQGSLGNDWLPSLALGERPEIEMQAEGEKAGELGAERSHKPSWQWPWRFRTARLSEGKWKLERHYLWGAPLEPGPEETALSCYSVETAANIYKSWALPARSWQGFQKQTVHLPGTPQATRKHGLLGKSADFDFISLHLPLTWGTGVSAEPTPPSRVGRTPGGWRASPVWWVFSKRPPFRSGASILCAGKHSWPCERKPVSHEVTKLLRSGEQEAEWHAPSHRCTNLISCLNISCSSPLKRNICIHLSSSLPFI